MELALVDHVPLLVLTIVVHQLGVGAMTQTTLELLGGQMGLFSFRYRRRIGRDFESDAEICHLVSVFFRIHINPFEGSITRMKIP